MPAHTNDVALATDDGSGVSGSTSLGDMTIAATYVYDGGHVTNIVVEQQLVKVHL